MALQAGGGANPHPWADPGSLSVLFVIQILIIHKEKKMSDLAIAAARVCSKCGQDLFLLSWGERFWLLVCDFYGCTLFRTPVGHIEKNGSGPDPESNRPRGQWVKPGTITAPGGRG
ncbi:hypothetical protein ES705_39900 [subsurface metagenome]